MKTGECYYKDENDILWLAVSYIDEDGTVITVSVEVES